ncbi:MAG: HAMP domain-containing histidine kinase [Tissierellia bacterium]|nr:HAMP domain-containing histidine kinase [Tissierellia bacterium]
MNFNDYDGEARPLREYIADYIDGGGGIIYIYSGRCGKRGLRDLEGILGAESESTYGPNKAALICRDDYFEGNTFDIDGLLKAGEDELNRLYMQGCNSSLIYIDIDHTYDLADRDELRSIFNKIRDELIAKNIKVIFRYTMRNIKPSYYSTLLMEHEIIFMERGDELKAHTPAELFDQLLGNAWHGCARCNTYEKGIKRIEHLKALGDIMEGAIHDINNLLSTIAGYVQLSLSIGQYSEVMKYLDIINKTALDGRNAVDNIKGYIRGSSNDGKSYYSFDEIVNRCIVMTKYKFKSSVIKDGKDLAIDISLNSNAMIYGNEYELRHSLINIIFNGVDSMGDSGVLTIRTYDRDGRAIIEIADTGKGIADGDISRVFEPYYTTKGSTGTGLGLNLVKNMVENHDGYIEVVSKLDKGTKFILSFPIAEIGDETDTDTKKNLWGA